MKKRSKHHDIFTTTRWTMVLKAGNTESSSAALEELCRIYWFPLYAYIRSRGYGKEDAEDTTQGFLAQFLTKCDFSSLKSEQGRFRAFLLASLKNYLAGQYDRNKTLKRGGGQNILSLDWETATRRFSIIDASAKTPEEIYDREWGLTLLQTVLQKLRQDWARKRETRLFDALQPFLTVDKEDMRYDRTAGELGMSEGSLRVAVHRLRKQYRNMLKDEIAQTLSDPSMVEEELRTLMKTFS